MATDMHVDREPGWYWIRRIPDGPWIPMRWHISARDGEELWVGSHLGEVFAEIGGRIYEPGQSSEGDATEAGRKLWHQIADGNMANAALMIGQALAFRDEQLGRRTEALRKALQKQHDWHLQSGPVGLPDGEGGWIEIDNAAEYSDSAMCSETMAALR